MSQNDLIISNASGAAVRADINSALGALGSTMKGPSAPPSPLAGMLWVDDDTPSASVWTLKAYDGTDWIALGYIDATNNRYTPTGLFAAGSAGSPSFAPEGDSDTGLWAPAANTLALSTAGSERARVTATGFVGVGITAPLDLLHVSRSDGNPAGLRAGNTNTGGGYARVQLYDIRGTADANRRLDIRNDGGVMKIGKMDDAETTFTEWGRLAGGQFLIGTTANDGTTNGISLLPGVDAVIRITSGAGARSVMGFYKDGGTIVGSIATSDTATTYNTSSDYRLKRDLTPIDGAAAVAMVAAIKPYMGRFASEGGDAMKRPMILAHEYATVVPHAVSGAKDAVPMQTAAYDPLIPVLVAAVQHLVARVAALEAGV